MTGHIDHLRNEVGREYVAEVFIAFKTIVNDPEGLEIQHGLQTLGFSEVSRVRSGKYFTITLRSGSETEARSRVQEMTERLLSNPIIEDYRIAISDAPLPR